MSSNDAPSMLGGHASYLKGAAEAAIGSVTGSQDYAQAGSQHKEEAIKEMRAANQGASGPDTSTLTGKASDAVGRAVGCEGMTDTETSETQVGQEDRYSSSHGQH